MKKALLVTVGTGQDVEDGIAFSVDKQRPDFVLFIVTGESLRDKLPLVLAKLKLAEEEYETRMTANENDVDLSVAEYVGYVQEVMRKGYAPAEIAVDFTSGTKAMSAALVVAALGEELGSMSYVHGRREGGRVISGTERLNALEPNLMLVDGKFRRAAELFNAHQYPGCLMVLEEVRGRTKEQGIRERADLLVGLAEGYRAWDWFDHGKALEGLDGVSREPLLSQWGLKKRVEAHKAFLHRAKSTLYGVERAADLWNNASRRAGEGKFDDAVARLYRLLEYTGQVKFYRDHGGLVAGDLEVEKLPESIREKYESKRGKDGKVELGLKEDYELLEDMGDQVGRQFMEEWRRKPSEIRSALGLRNNSILAHGFGPVGEEGYRRAAVIVEGYMDKVFPGWREEVKKAEFPQCPHAI